jgi:hypothetical protein
VTGVKGGGHAMVGDIRPATHHKKRAFMKAPADRGSGAPTPPDGVNSKHD